ncbi:hypothetical protein BKA70DRAFT_1534677 [Coprinopsis sp. MPI-PUGE-AT-0042]|nr:hypothetical protein BKA70DRAFT_1534677 [Coprinopsis sp. MPI-PUGE-AT-0042]
MDPQTRRADAEEVSPSSVAVTQTSTAPARDSHGRFIARELPLGDTLALEANRTQIPPAHYPTRCTLTEELASAEAASRDAACRDADPADFGWKKVPNRRRVSHDLSEDENHKEHPQAAKTLTRKRSANRFEGLPIEEGRDDVVDQAEKQLTPEQREAIYRRNRAVQDSAVQFDREEGSSQRRKGKGPDPREWGNIQLNESEGELETQEVMYRSFQSRNRVPRDPPPHLSKYRTPVHDEAYDGDHTDNESKNSKKEKKKAKKERQAREKAATESRKSKDPTPGPSRSTPFIERSERQISMLPINQIGARSSLGRQLAGEDEAARKKKKKRSKKKCSSSPSSSSSSSSSSSRAFSRYYPTVMYQHRWENPHGQSATGASCFSDKAPANRQSYLVIFQILGTQHA